MKWWDRLSYRMHVFILLVAIVPLAGFVLLLPLQALAQNEHLPDHQDTLKSASELDYPPFSIVNPDGTAGGFSVELLNAAAAAAGFDVSFKVAPWSELKEELAAGALDVLPLVSYSADREKVYDFTTPYLQMNGAVFVRKDTAIRNLSDLMGKEVLVMRGDTAHEYVMKEHLTDKIIPTTSYEDAFRLLAMGKHDAVVVQQIVGLEIIKKLGIKNVIPVKQKNISTLKPMTLKLEGFEQKFCFAVRKGNHELQSRLNEGLTVVYLNGTYNTLYEKWFAPLFPEPKISAGEVVKKLLVILVPLLLIIALLGIWSLKRLVAKRTQVLEQEIQQRRLTEEHLSKSEGQFRTLVKTIPDLVWLKDTDGVFLACNPMFENFLGAREADIIGKTDYDFVDRELADFFIKNDRRAMEAGKPTTNEEWLTFSNDGHRALYETIKTPLYDSNGTIVGVLGIARDISERKRAEEERARLEAQLLQAQKLEAIGVLAGGFAHDFNNILSAILGFTELAKQSNPADQQLQEDLNEIYTAGNRAKELVQRIFAFSRQQKHSPVLLDVREAVEEALQFLRSTLPVSIALEVTVNEGLGPIRAEPVQLNQIIMNLCTNACQAMTEHGGILTVKVSKIIPSDVFFTDHPHLARSSYIKLVFQDTGTGIAPEIIGSVFDPYFTTKNYGDGTGLGLSVTYGIIQEMSGDIAIESEPEKGSIVTVLLPVAIREESNS